MAKENLKAKSCEKPEISRPWGGYTIVKKSKDHWIKKLFINSKARLSLQSHECRNEVWYVCSGTIKVQNGNRIKKGKSGDVFFIPKKKKHRIIGVNNACVLEIAFGRVLERDIIRYKDDYGRS